MDLFDFLPTLFNKTGWEEISDSIKKKHCFMVQRILSMKYPMQTQHFNRLNTNPVAVMDTWHMIMSRQFSRPPDWTFQYSKIVIKTDKKAAKRSAEAIAMYKRNNELCDEDYEMLVELFPDEVSGEIKIYEEYI